MPRLPAPRAASLLTLGLLLVAVVLAAVAIADGESTRRVRDGRHAFISLRDGASDLFVRPASGGPAVALTDDPAPDAEPAWSPDGNASRSPASGRATPTSG